MKYLLSDILKEYSEKNSLNKYYPVAVGKYGIRKRSDIYKKELAKDYSKNKIIRKNTLIVGMGSTQIDIGVLSSDEIFSVSPAYHTFNISDKIVDSRYLDLLFLSKNNEYTQKYMIASARQGKTVNLKDLLKEIIEIPNFEQQYEIINKIEKIKKFIQFEEENISYYEELIKSRFIEMFGDPISNDKNWEFIPITNVCKNILGGGTPSKSKPEYYNGNIPWVTPKDMKHTIISDSIDHITEDAIKNSSTNLIETNSILMVVRSGILKHTLPVAINEIPVTINQDMKAFIPNKKVTTRYLLYYFKIIENDVLSGVRSVTADNIDFKTFQKRKIIIPPIELQNKFAEFVQLIDKLKFIAQKRIDLYTELLNKKMDEYF
ncbi:MAG: restriction endonuclease subunit S, partial [Methanobrevibacter sp.]|nr:restriction endonuclease subunit S [Methanobrevibacter sp.]